MVVSTVSENVSISSSVFMFKSKYNNSGLVVSFIRIFTISASTGTNGLPFISSMVLLVSAINVKFSAVISGICRLSSLRSVSDI